MLAVTSVIIRATTVGFDGFVHDVDGNIIVIGASDSCSYLSAVNLYFFDSVLAVVVATPLEGLLGTARPNRFAGRVLHVLHATTGVVTENVALRCHR